MVNVDEAILNPVDDSKESQEKYLDAISGVVTEKVADLVLNQPKEIRRFSG